MGTLGGEPQDQRKRGSRSAQDPQALGPRSARILVVEDDPDVRHLVKVAVEQAGFDVAVEADGTEIRRVVAWFRPDLAILDVTLAPGPDGLAVARMLRDVSDLPILFLTAATSLEDRLAGFSAGGDDYLTKPFAISELLARCRALLQRSGRLESRVLKIGDCVIDVDGRTVTRGHHEVALTRTEFDLLATLARNTGRVLSKPQLLAGVWGFDAYDVHLVEVHMSSLRRKLHTKGPPLIHTVRGIGYVMRTTAPPTD
jgi:two-component system OmpR family response regulator